MGALGRSARAAHDRQGQHQRDKRTEHDETADAGCERHVHSPEKMDPYDGLYPKCPQPVSGSPCMIVGRDQRGARPTNPRLRRFPAVHGGPALARELVPPHNIRELSASACPPPEVARNLRSEVGVEYLQGRCHSGVWPRPDDARRPERGCASACRNGATAEATEVPAVRAVACSGLHALFRETGYNIPVVRAARVTSQRSAWGASFSQPMNGNM